MCVKNCYDCRGQVAQHRVIQDIQEVQELHRPEGGVWGRDRVTSSNTFLFSPCPSRHPTCCPPAVYHSPSQELWLRSALA